MQTSLTPATDNAVTLNFWCQAQPQVEKLETNGSTVSTTWCLDSASCKA